MYGQQQNFPLAVIAGIFGAVVGAVIWTTATVISNYKTGVVAILIGIMVGMAIRGAGKGTDQKFAILGALCSLLGGAMGDILSDVALYSKLKHLDFVAVAFHTNAAFLAKLVCLLPPHGFSLLRDCVCRRLQILRPTPSDAPVTP